MLFAAIGNARDLIEIFVVAQKPWSRRWVPDRVAVRRDRLYPADSELMFRFVDSPKGLVAYSTVTSGLAFVAIVFFGAPPIIYFFSTCAMVAFLEFAKRHNGRKP